MSCPASWLRHYQRLSRGSPQFHLPSFTHFDCATFGGVDQLMEETVLISMQSPNDSMEDALRGLFAFRLYRTDGKYNV